MKKEETFEEQVMRVLNTMVKEGEVYKISVNGEEMYALADPIPVEPQVKCKPRIKSYTAKKTNLNEYIKKQKYLARGQKGAITRKLNTLLRSLGAK